MAADVVSATAFEPNVNLPLEAPKSIPPLPNENLPETDFAVSLEEVAAAVSLSLAC